MASRSDNSYFPKGCSSCKFVYGSFNCDVCKYNMYGLGEEDRYEPIDTSEIIKNDVIISDTNKIHDPELKPNTIYITIPEGVESIVINFKKNKE